MKILSTLAGILTACIVPTVLVAADQYAGDDQVDDNYNDDYAGNNNAYEGFSVCDNTAIEVTNVYMYCDSPGTFYYGSGKYRNSQNCTAGDKGKYFIEFYINDAATIEATGGLPIVDISATGTSGWYQNDQKVLENEELCSLSSLKSLSGSACPAQGKYRISSHFYWQEDDTSGGTFNPMLTVGFKSSIYESTYDYGGANTKYCSGTTFFTSLRNNVKKIYANSVTNFFKTFGVLVFTIGVMASFIWLMVKKPTSIQDARKKMFRRRNAPVHDGYDDDSSYDDSDDFDFDKMKSPYANQSTLDF